MKQKKPMKKITFEFTEKEFVMTEMTMRKVCTEFIKMYKIFSKKREEEMDKDQMALYTFYRDATLIAESLQKKMEKVIKKEGTETYNFDPFEVITENALKGDEK